MRITFGIGIVLGCVLPWAASHADQTEYQIVEKVIEDVPVRWVRPEISRDVISTPPPEANEDWLAMADTPVTEFVPLGVYTGDYGDAFWPFMLRDIVARHGNLVFPNGNSSWPAEWVFPGEQHQSRLFSSSAEGLEMLTRMAADSGVRVYYQNGNSPLHWPIREHIGPPRPEVYERAASWVEDVLPAYAEDPQLRAGLLAWGITEEIDLSTARDPLLRQLKEKVEAADPHHPPVVLIMPHTMDVQQALIETWGSVPIIITDHYLSHRGLNQDSLWSFNLQRLGLWSDYAIEQDAKFWLMTSCFSMMSDIRPEGTSGYRNLDPNEVKMSMWTALSYGSSGFMLFKYYDDDSWGRSCLTRFDFKPTEEYIAASRFFRRVDRLSPLVGKWQRVGEVEFDQEDGVVIGVFKHPDYEGTFRVVSNVSAWDTATYRSRGAAYELEGFNKITKLLRIDGGEGVVLFQGKADEVKRLRETLGVGLDSLVVASPPIETVETWRWTEQSSEPEKENAKSGTIIFGGKGAKPSIQRPSIDSPQRGDLIAWDDTIKLPSGMYYPPYPDLGEDVLFVQYDLSNIQAAEIDRAILTLRMNEAVEGGRIAVYPVVDKGLGATGMTEYMPRWERFFINISARGSLDIDVTGIVAEWMNGELSNHGFMVVYEGFPGEGRTVNLAKSPVLSVRYQPE